MDNMDLFCLIALWTLFKFWCGCDANNLADHGWIRYSREELLQFNIVSATQVVDFLPQLPDIILRQPHGKQGKMWGKRRKRGKRGGVKLRLRKQRLTRLPLPSVILGNVRSLRNKIEELQGNVRCQKDFKNCGVLAFTETWLNEQDSDADLHIDGFGTPLRLDRKVEVTGKKLGGGVCLYVNERYWSAVTVREQICTSDVELLKLSLRPFYLPREFPQIFLTVVYIHPKADAVAAANTIFEVEQKLQSISPEAPNFILGDFNHVSLKKVLSHYQQYVTCPTRRNKTLDMCYGSVKDAYKSLLLPPLGSADHSCVFLLPIYKTILRREKVQVKDVKVWTEESILCLQECYECTDWNVFRENCGDDLDELTDVTCSYVAFCRDMIIPLRGLKSTQITNHGWTNLLDQK